MSAACAVHPKQNNLLCLEQIIVSLLEASPYWRLQNIGMQCVQRAVQVLVLCMHIYTSMICLVGKKQKLSG